MGHHAWLLSMWYRPSDSEYSHIEGDMWQWWQHGERRGLVGDP